MEQSIIPYHPTTTTTTTLPLRTSNTTAVSTPPSLTHIPDELLFQILTYLDLPDLLHLSRTTHHLRSLSLDPILHANRLHSVPSTLSRSLTHRPTLATLITHRIYLTRTTLASRSLSRNLIKIKLNRSLSRRPSATALVEKGVLPSETTYLAPSLIETKRRIEREKVKDVLRHWIEEWRRKGDEMGVGEREVTSRPDVRRIARRFMRGNGNNATGETRWGPGALRRKEKEMPTRAKVLGLRRFWEKVGRDGITGGHL